jgi:anaerobic ribonucleoside-triphosphate reductase activating protein
MNYAEIKYCDIANGVGARTSLFVSGCRHHCKGCFNEVAWDFGYGGSFDAKVEDAIIDSLKPDYIAGLSILGGEPLEPENQEDVLRLLERVTDEYPEKTVWMWTGFTWEELMGGCRASTDMLPEILDCVDVLVDGPFINDQRDITLRFRGSPNQRIIDVTLSILAGKVIPWTDGHVYATRTW